MRIADVLDAYGDAVFYWWHALTGGAIDGGMLSLLLDKSNKK